MTTYDVTARIRSSAPAAESVSFVIMTDGGGKIVGSNPAAQRFFGCAAGQLRGRSLEELLEPAGREYVRESLAAFGPEGTGCLDRSASVQMRHVQGSECRAMVSASSIYTDARPVVAFVFQVIAGNLGQAEMLRRLVDALPDYLFIKDVESRIVMNNVAHARNLGTVPANCVGKTDRDFFEPHLADMYIASEQNVVRQGCVFQDEEETVDRKGNHRWVLTTKIPLRDESGAIIGLAGINHDITETKLAQRALAESEESHRTLYHNTPVMLHSVDLDGKILHVSDYWLRCLGYTREEVVGRSSLDFYTEASRMQMTQTTIPEFRRTGRMNSVPLEILTRDGAIIAVEVSAIAQHDHDKKMVSGLVVSIDVTQRRKAEAEREELHKRLIEVSRHAGMAEVATGVLHNVGNVLNSVNTSTGLLMDKLRNSPVKKLARAVDLMRQHASDLGAFITSDPQGSKLPSYFTTVTGVLQTEETAMLEELSLLSKHVDHIKEIVKVQQSFAKTTRIIESVDLAALIEDAIRININEADRGPICIDCDFPRPMRVNTDKHSVLQIVTNLVRNAYHAVRDNSKVEKRITIRSVRESRGGREVFRIEVSDNGVGIDPQNITRIFNHGFTTKENGHGFGLHSSANTAKRLGGTLEANSQGPGTGATFVLTLPACKEVNTK
jgi:PAS domain S-box-containing protein